MKLVQVLMKGEQSGGGRGRDELVTTWVAPLLIETGQEGGRAELVTTWVVPLLSIHGGILCIHGSLELVPYHPMQSYVD